MNADIEQKLGFDRVRQLVSEQTTNALAAQMAQQMSFCADYDRLSLELQLTEEMRQIELMSDAFPRQDFIDLSPELHRLRVQGTAIEPEMMFDLKVSLQTIEACLRFFSADKEGESPLYPQLDQLASTVATDSTIEKELRRIVDDHGEIYDNASPKLFEIRQTIARKRGEVDMQVSRALARAKREGWAAEGAEATLRDGRPVIPLLTTHRRKMQGLIQDESASRQTAFVEPAEVVELGNDLRELEFDERHEVQRILLDFSNKLRPLLPLYEQAYHFLAQIDFLRAKARVAIMMNATVPLLHDTPTIEWHNARHPLLFLQKGDAVVPFSLALATKDHGHPERILIISGPNAGGKSVCLKAVGLIQYMLQCGMAIPVRPTSECGIFGSIFIDIGDQQSIDNDLSTYTSHLQNMKQLLCEANNSTLFLLDELGGGTEPRSGCAIAEAVLEQLHERQCVGVVTTHFADLKLLADRLPLVVNGAMLYDTVGMHPLYKLSVGHPGSSFAFEIAQSIGFPQDVLQRAGEKVGLAQLNFEHQLQQLEIDKKEVAKQREALQAADEVLNEVVEKYRTLSEQLTARRNDIVGQARREAQQILANANRTVERTISDIKTAQAERQATLEARQRLAAAVADNTAELQSMTANPPKKTKQPARQPSEQPPTAIKAGTIVRIDGHDTFGQVVSISGKKAVVESNSMRMTIAIDRLEGTAKQKLPQADRPRQHTHQSVFDEMNEKRQSFNPTLDLRGQRATDAIDQLHHFIDEALLLSEKEVRVLHGKGNGVLMSVIRQELLARRDVRTFHAERLELGGEGITVVELR